MIVVRLRGGLGNQMFQYAAGRARALAGGEKLAVDLRWFRGPGALLPHRTYDLGIFKLRMQEATSIQILISKLRRTYMDGFWQKPSHFASSPDAIRQDFEFAAPLLPVSLALAEEVARTESVCIHVRRADFVKYNMFIGLEYYHRAVSRMLSSKPDACFYIFSDEIEWCRANFSFLPNATFVGPEHAGPKSGNYLQLMAHCKHFIIPNSTFAWWAAWLSRHAGKIVIAPSEWRQAGGSSTNDIVPEGWIRV